MSSVLFKIMATLIILTITLLGGVLPFLKKKRFSALTRPIVDISSGESFASGVFLGASLLHMLPNAANAFWRAGYHYPFPFLIAASMFLLLLLLEHITTTFQHHRDNLNSHIMLLTVMMLSIHAVLEGTAVGMATRYPDILILFVAILAHKGVVSFALSSKLNASKFTLGQSSMIFGCFALMTPLGIVLGNSILLAHSSYKLLMPIVTSMAAGTFLYIGTLHGLDRANLIKTCCNIREFLIMLFGFIMMAFVAIWT